MNCKLVKLCCILFLLFMFNSISFAQQNNSATKEDSTVSADPADSANGDNEIAVDTVITRTLFARTNDSILALKKSREFGYMVYLDSLLRKKTDLKIDTVSIDKGAGSRRNAATASAQKNNENSFLNSFPVKIFFWAIAIFFIGFVMFKLFFTSGLFTKGNVRPKEEQVIEEPEQLNEFAEYNDLIQEAESKNNFNLAVRYLYLQSLKRLSDRELILFAPDKTNNLYVQELYGQNYQHEFASLTLNYEYAWYGKFAIDSMRYQKLKDEFILFNKKV